MLWPLLDILLNVIHSGLILFILFGAFSPKTARWHFYVASIVWISWLVVGIYMGHLGYCPLTEWHWHIKRLQGETLLPPSYVEYVYTKITGEDVNNLLMQGIIAAVTLAVTVVSGIKYLKFRTT